ncbi:ABC transporter substrate-binding protein [Candidatus Sumerlaeota bacterium]|nr:ABC transporter substrate-binding protein [Candidatus Sumerlaeota bacterium]
MKTTFIAFFILVVFFFGCSREESQLTFSVGGAPNEVDYWETIIHEFEEAENVQVNFLRQPTDTDQRRQGLVIPLKAEEDDPDVFLMDVAWVGQFSTSGWLEPLDAFIRKDGFQIDAMFQPVIEQVDRSPNGIIALPVYLDCGILYYRKDLLEKYGFDIPETWNDLVKASEKIQGGERGNNPMFFGFVWQGAQYEGLMCNFLEYISSNGGSLGDLGKKDITIDRKENEEALTFMRDLIHTYKISPPNTFTEMKEEEVRHAFQSGNALFERNWPYAWKLHQSDASPVKDKVGIAILPAFAGCRSAAALGGWHIGISRFSDHKEEAWKLVSFIMSYDAQKKLALNLGWNPGRKDIYQDAEVINKKPEMDVLKSALAYAVARPNVPYYSLMSSILQRYIHAAISGEMAPGEALSGAQGDIQKTIDSYHE